MTTIDEARATLEEGRHLYASGHWDDLYSKLHPVHEAGVLEGTEKGESAFYLGEACLYKGNPDHVAGMMYLDEAIPLATVDFSQWAKEELTKAQHPADHAQAADQAHPAGPDVSGHPDLMAGIHLPDWVAHAQAKLVHLNCYTGRVDGMFGPSVDAAVKYLQGHYQLTADGVIGQTTWTVLETYAPGVTGHPDGSADQAHAADPHADQAHAADPHAAQAHAGQAHAADPNAGTMTMPADSIQGGHPATEKPWNPEDPGVLAPKEEAPVIGQGGEFEWKHPFKVHKELGPVMIEEITVKASGKLSGEKGRYVSVTGTLGNNPALKIETASWKLVDAKEWKVSLKGNAEIGKSSGISGTLEVVHEPIIGELEFTLVKLDKGEFKVAELTGSIGAQVEDAELVIDGHRVYFSGKISAGLSLVPNVKWLVEKGAMKAGETAAQASTTAAAGGGEATAVEGGGAAVIGAEVIITTGFIAAAVAVLYVGYENMQDIEALKRLRTDADKAVEDFSSGFAAAWSGSGGPGGFWGDAGHKAGERQFNADFKAFQEHMKAKNQPMTAATEDEVKKMWHDTAAQKADAFAAVVAAMFGKMVRTAIYQSWLKANSNSSLPGDVSKHALDYAGISGGQSTAPDVMAAQAAAKNANMQNNIDAWQHSIEP